MKSKKTNEGFSLIELIFTVAFLTLIITGAVKLQTSGLMLGNQQSNEVNAGFFANQGAEVAESLGKAVINSVCGAPPCSCEVTAGYGMTCTGTPETIDSTYSRSIEVESTGIAGNFLISSKVMWEDSSGEHFVSAKRVIFN